MGTLSPHPNQRTFVLWKPMIMGLQRALSPLPGLRGCLQSEVLSIFGFF